MSRLGRIEIREHYMLGKLERRSYKWIGPPLCKVSSRVIGDINYRYKLGDDLTLGQFRLKYINHSWASDLTTFVRKDFPFWWLVYFICRLTPKIDLVYRRLILTLTIWNLAEYQPGAVPSWRDINIIQRLILKNGN